MDARALLPIGMALAVGLAGSAAWAQAAGAPARSPGISTLSTQTIKARAASPVLVTPSLSSLRETGVSLVTAKGESAVAATLEVELQQPIPEKTQPCTSFFSTDCMASVSNTFVATAVTGGSQDRTALPLGNPKADASVTYQFRYSKTGWQRDDKAKAVGAALCNALDAALNAKPLLGGGSLPEKSRECTLANLRKHVGAPDLEDQINVFTGKAHGSVMHLGLEATAGQRTVTLRDPSTLEGSDRVLRPQSVSLFVGYQPHRGWKPFGRSTTDEADRVPGATLFLFKGTWGRDFRDQDPRIACLTSTDVPPVTRCVEGSYDAPTKVNPKRWSVELRHQLDNGFGLGLIATEDRASKKRRIDIPLYLSSDKDGKLTGGLMLSRTSGSSRLEPSLFIGVPFSVSL